ncbi:hypothetical protein [Limosilactobacillus mucosae]|uniref:hypothetical protein n=1 Tax=Limosilactobacillus mucosae TaxID=97478 RepID=UPI0022E305EF|nr:hypothetical protein [Limosilactobacillus mucosae]
MNKGFKIALALGLMGVSCAATTVVTNTSSNDVMIVQASKRSRIKKAVAIMRDSYSDVADVYYDKENKVIAIKPTDESFEEEMVAVLNGDESEEDWDELTASIDNLSETVYEKCHIKTPIAIVNPENTDKVLYMSYDGTSLYDVTDDNN